MRDPGGFRWRQRETRPGINKKENRGNFRRRPTLSVSRIFTQKYENQAAMQKEKNDQYRRS